MAKIEAVACDTCNRVERPVEGHALPMEWYQATVYQQGSGELLSDGTFCSWDCVNLAMKVKEPEPRPRRKRRTREQIEADNAAAAANA